MENIAKAINILGQFCGKRDIAELTSEQLQDKYGITQADVMVLFGGSIMCGGDILAKAMKEGIAKTYEFAKEDYTWNFLFMTHQTQQLLSANKGGTRN